MERLTVIGSGTMGHSIALNAAWMGMEVTMHCLSNAEIDLAMQGIASKVQVLKDNGLEVDVTIAASTDMKEAVANASFIIEAVPEVLSVKQELFAMLEGICDEQVVLASNTSGIEPDAMANNLKHPERFIVTHFWNPAHLIPLVEIVPCAHTNETTLLRAQQLLQQMQKKCITLKRSIPGFIGNRLQYALFREAQYLLEQGIASKEDIDAAVTYSIGRRLPVTGPLLSADMGGLDVFSTISDYLFKELSNAGESLPVLRSLVNQHKLGPKTGEGFYEWDAAFTTAMNTKRENELIRFLKQDLEDE